MRNMYKQPKVRYVVVFPNGFFACRKGGLHQVPNIMMATHFRNQDEGEVFEFDEIPALLIDVNQFNEERAMGPAIEVRFLK